MLITFVARTYYIPSGSMLPTLQIHDVLLVDKFEYRFHQPNDGDIVVFPPPVPTPDDFIKRVIGRPGDSLRVAGGTVYVNGRPLNEPYVAERPSYSLEIRNYGIYVSYGDGWQRLDPGQANVPPKSQLDRAGSHSAALLLHVRATIGTTPRIRTFGASRRTPAVSRAVRAPATRRVSPAARS